MALWKEQSGKETVPPMADPGLNGSESMTYSPDRPLPGTASVEPARRPATAGAPAKESLIAADVTIEGKIEGAGHIRIAGRFKGDVNVEGNVTVESGAHVTGQLRANTVVVSGEVQGNIRRQRQGRTARDRRHQRRHQGGHLERRSRFADARPGRLRLEGQGPRRQVAAGPIMLNSRAAPGTVGRTRSCPHCKATILESSAICPQCRHHLKFGAAAAPGELTKSFSALRVEGAVRHPEQGGECEFSVVLAIVNERGEEVSRQVVGVGALRPSESRTFRLSVDVHTRDQKPR